MREVIEGEYLPQALAMGVEYSLFYTLNPNKLKPFVKAYELQQQLELDKIYLETWLSGHYVTLAISTALGGEYPEQPITVEETTRIEQENKEEAQKIRDEINAIKFTEMVEAFNKGFRERGEK